MPHSFFFFCLVDVFATMIGEIKVSYICEFKVPFFVFLYVVFFCSSITLADVFDDCHIVVRVFADYKPLYLYFVTRAANNKWNRNRTNIAHE